jgi:hypothetical protein
MYFNNFWATNDLWWFNKDGLTGLAYLGPSKQEGTLLPFYNSVELVNDGNRSTYLKDHSFQIVEYSGQPMIASGADNTERVFGVIDLHDKNRGNIYLDFKTTTAQILTLIYCKSNKECRTGVVAIFSEGDRAVFVEEGKFGVFYHVYEYYTDITQDIVEGEQFLKGITARGYCSRSWNQLMTAEEAREQPGKPDIV